MADYSKKRQKVVVGQLQVVGQTQTINSQTITVLKRDGAGLITKATGTAAASTQDAQAVYAKSAEYIKTNVATGTAALYENIGDTSSSSFNLIGGISAGEITLARGNLLVGNSSGVAAALDANNSGQILVGDGTDLASVAVSGDATLASTGALTVTGSTGQFAVGTKLITGSTTTSTGAGAVAITGVIHEITTTGTGDALTLANGTEGQWLAVVYVAEGAAGDTAILTPTNLAGADNTITFTDIGDTAYLLFTAGTWNVMGRKGINLAVSELTLAEGNLMIGNSSGVGVALDIGNTNAGIAIGDGTTATIAALSGDVTMTNTGAVTIAAGAVTNPKIADSNGTGALGIRKSATVLYDFTVVGGAQGTIVLTGSPTIPDNAVVWVESYDVITTCTSGGGDAANIALQLPTDGALTTAIAISDGTNPWDEGVKIMGQGGLVTPLPKKTTAARVPSLLVAGGQDLTAGKIVFQLGYWVSQ